jgi:hypothetical protein
MISIEPPHKEEEDEKQSAAAQICHRFLIQTFDFVKQRF